MVGDADRILVVLVRNDRDDGAENLLARDRHVVADVREQRRLDEIAYLDAIGAPGAAGLQRGAFLDPLGDQPLHLLPLRLVKSEEHTSELQSLMRISYAVFCLKKKKQD